MRNALYAALLLAAPAASADQIEDALDAALEAYRAGDFAAAKEEADFAATLLGQKKAAGLTDYLPAAFDGWTRTDGDAQAIVAAMFGGGMAASASYGRNGETVEAQILADSPMIATMGAMLGSPAMMANMGEVKRKGRHRYVVTNDGEVMALLGGRVMVQVGGSASTEDKAAYFEAIDLDALESF
jgi:hypothetical protein